MARLAGVELQDSWRVEYALTKVKGIGWSLSKAIAGSMKFEPARKIGDLNSEDMAKLAAKIEEYVTEGDLLRTVRGNVQRLKTIGAYRGVRHTRNLPVRGQRTRRNARTKRGKRKTVGAFKKEMLAKAAQATK